MKNFYSFALLAGAAFGSEDVGLWRWSTQDTTEMLNKTGGTKTFKWTMYTKTGYEEDTGYEYFRIQHELEADIKASDEVTFEIAYTMANDPWTNKMIMSDDGVICKVVQSTQNTVFWDQTSEDIYYKCTNAYNCYHQAIGTGSQLFEQGSDDSTGANWTNPLADDDEDNPYCTAHTDSTYACSKVKCITQRLLVTDDTYDFDFLPTSSAPDVMTIGPGRGRLGINELDCSTKCTYLPNNLWETGGEMAAITVKVRAGASSMVAGVVGTITAAALLAF